MISFYQQHWNYLCLKSQVSTSKDQQRKQSPLVHQYTDDLFNRTGYRTEQEKKKNGWRSELEEVSELPTTGKVNLSTEQSN